MFSGNLKLMLRMHLAQSILDPLSSLRHFQWNYKLARFGHLLNIGGKMPCGQTRMFGVFDGHKSCVDQNVWSFTFARLNIIYTLVYLRWLHYNLMSPFWLFFFVSSYFGKILRVSKENVATEWILLLLIFHSQIFF